MGNQVESLVINPLSRWLFDNEVLGDAELEIEDFLTTARPPAIVAHVKKEEA